MRITDAIVTNLKSVSPEYNMLSLDYRIKPPRQEYLVVEFVGGEVEGYLVSGGVTADTISIQLVNRGKHIEIEGTYDFR